ncbi:MAG: hypothetical protein KatS3mg102_2209 [Planctomycetota bacterium]|nr:MAG: hypothetical protein KatS3mg102_2209 [Planctomycetota bacterium]
MRRVTSRAFAPRPRALAAALERAGTVVLLDPGCARALHQFAPACGIALAPRLVHVSVYLRQRLARLRGAGVPAARRAGGLPRPVQPRGATSGSTRRPRALLQAAAGGKPPRELAQAREQAACSGAGGVYRKIWPRFAGRIAARRLEEFDGAGAARLATACPSCVRQLGRERPPGTVVDVLELLAEAMGLGPG